jgi:uncharacterized protein (TIGR02266 family)
MLAGRARCTLITMSRCIACGEDLPEDAQFCGYCGFRIGPVPLAPPRVIRVAAPGSDDASMGVAETVRVDLASLQQRPSDTLPQSGRRLERFPMRVDVHFSSAHNFFTGSSRNLSKGGLFVATFRPAPVGQLLKLTFTLPGLNECSVMCEVRWVRPPGEGAEPGMGLRFIGLDPETEEAMEAFIAHREPILREE